MSAYIKLISPPDEQCPPKVMLAEGMSAGYQHRLEQKGFRFETPTQEEIDAYIKENE